MWEITSLGETPYAEYDAADMEQVLGKRLSSPYSRSSSQTYVPTS